MFTRFNHIYTELSQWLDDALQVRVRTDDDGPSNHTHVHVWDENGEYADIPMDHAGKVWGDDDLFERMGARGITRDELKAKNPNLDVDHLVGVTAFEQFPNGYREWERRDHAVSTRAKDRQVLTNRAPGQFMHRDFVRSVAVDSGEVELAFHKADKTGYKSAYGFTALTGITYRDTANRFGGAPEVHILVNPIVDTQDSRIDYSAATWRSNVVKKEFLDLNQGNLITLIRGQDGVYRAEADPDKSFLRIDEAFIYNGGAGDKRDFKAVRFALAGPNGQWDSNDGSDYTAIVNAWY